MDLKQLMKDSGIVGAGGAGFPSYAKLAEGADTLIVNGSECEPLLYTDFTIMKREMPYVLEGAEAVLDFCRIPRALLCIKAHNAKRLGLTEGEGLSKRVFVKVLPDVYPIGDEVSLIYQATGKVVRPGNLPITSGVIVYNVETMYNLARAIRFGEPVTGKWLTVGGDVPEPCVMRVPVGTRVADLFAKLGITVDEAHVVVDGGPSMGKPINYELAAVSKTTKALIVLPRSCRAAETKFLNEKMAVARAETACCQCTRCTDMCPRNLLGYSLEPHKMVRTAMGAAEVAPALVLSATLCCGCGICESLACSQGISPRAVINNYKALLGAKKMRYTAKEDTEPRPERDFRMIPSEKWASILGVHGFDKIPGFIGEVKDFDRVEIPLGRFIGVPSVPSVETGTYVKAGDRIGIPAEGLSVGLAASIDGRVTVTDTKIIIDKV